MNVVEYCEKLQYVRGILLLKEDKVDLISLSFIFCIFFTFFIFACSNATWGLSTLINTSEFRFASISFLH